MTALEIDVRLPLDRFELRVEAALGTASATAIATGVFGASGAGKSSLLEIIAGLRRGARGRLAFAGDVWLDSARRIFVPPRRRGVGWVPQEGLLFPHWTVRRNLLAGARRDGAALRDPRQLFAAVVELLELAPLLERLPQTLSGGERQRVALGRALCSAPRLLLLDEPLAALDLPLRRRLLGFLHRVREELTVPLLLVSHDPVEVQGLCDEVLVLRRGEVVARGTPRRILTDPELVPRADRAAEADTAVENVLPARIVGHGDATTHVRLEEGDGDGGTELVALRIAAEVGTSVLVNVAASEILLATERPHGLSARNVLAGRAASIRVARGAAWVTVELAGGARLVVEVAETTPARLGLEPGGEVFLVVKAASVRIHGG